MIGHSSVNEPLKGEKKIIAMTTIDLLNLSFQKSVDVSAKPVASSIDAGLVAQGRESRCDCLST